MPTQADHEVQVQLTNNHAVPIFPPNMKVPETVHYFSTDGVVTLQFVENGSPFVDAAGNPKTEITSSDPPMALSNPGTFTCRCFITLPDGTTVGWDPSTPESGGNQIVK